MEKKKEIRVVVPEVVHNRIKVHSDYYGQKLSNWVLQVVMEKVIELERAGIARESLDFISQLKGEMEDMKK